MTEFNFVLKMKFNQLPQNSGVYCFKNREKILYVGKASNIQDRAKSHFRRPTYRDNFFVRQVSKIGYIKTGSEIEALILEANLIKKYKPKYNVLWKDDKNFFYVAITKERFPRVFITHQIEKLKVRYIGPFVDGRALRQTLKYLRKVFPYYSAPKHPQSLCPWCHLELCPGPEPDAKEYKKSVQKLIGVLEGRRKFVVQELRKEMTDESKNHNFEKAAKIRDQISSLEKVILNARIILPWQINRNQEKPLNANGRIEAYDISNIQGKFAVGSMVVFTEGRQDKNEYRKFKIRCKKTPDDTAMLKEVLSRRFRHAEWHFPELIIVDGGKAQLNAAKLAIQHYNLKTKMIALTKDKRHKGVKIYTSDKKEPIKLSGLPSALRNLIMQIDDEAHRFAIAYHRKLRDIDPVRSLTRK